jgi:hypothetical protein
MPNKISMLQRQILFEWKLSSHCLFKLQNGEECIISTCWQYNKKENAHPTTGHEGPQAEQRYSFTLSLTSALYGFGWSTPRPSRFTSGNFYITTRNNDLSCHLVS